MCFFHLSGDGSPKQRSPDLPLPSHLVVPRVRKISSLQRVLGLPRGLLPVGQFKIYSIIFLMISSLWSDTDMHILFLLILIILCHKEFLFSFSPLNISWTDGKILNFKNRYSLFLNQSLATIRQLNPPHLF